MREEESSLLPHPCPVRRNFSLSPLFHVQYRLCWLRQDLFSSNFFVGLHSSVFRSNFTKHSSSSQSSWVKYKGAASRFHPFDSSSFTRWNSVHPHESKLDGKKTKKGGRETMEKISLLKAPHSSSLLFSHKVNVEFKFKRNSLKSNNGRIRSILVIF